MGQRYFLEQAPAPDSSEAILDGQEAQHLLKVMRAKPGDQVELFDGSGWQWQARVEEIRRNDATLQIVSSAEVSREPSIALVLGIALPKGDRQKWVIGKLVELGVHRVVPLITENGVAQPVEKAIVRLRRQVIEASKQCGRNRLMEITAPQHLSEFLSQTYPNCWIAHPPSAPGAEELEFAGSEALDITAGEAAVAIGPEGGFCEAEVDQALAAGWSLLELGARILRIETAAMAVAARMLLGR